MHKLRMEMRLPTACERMPITVDTLGEIKRDQTENSCLLFVSVVVTEFVYANTIIPFNLGE